MKNKAKPFLRWAGGKRWLIKNLDNFLPEKFNNYHEPFLGGGAIFFHLKSNNLIEGDSFLSDLNEELINAYKQVKQNPKEIISSLKNLKTTKEAYYEARSLILTTSYARALRFIYLNKTSYNGLYRVNSKGKYNVPYGNRKVKNLFGYENILNVSKILNQNVYLDSKDFYSVIDNVKEKDLVFLDPPYVIDSKNNGFVEYNQETFTWKDQEKLFQLIKEIDQKGAYYILTNIAHLNVKNLFSEIGFMHQIQRNSNIGGKGAKRMKINEYIFTNTNNHGNK